MLTNSFSNRSEVKEQMDDLLISGPMVDQTLKELDIINRWLGGNPVTIKGLQQLRPQTTKEMHVADLGCGSGEMLKLLAKWGSKQGVRLRLTGVDANPYIIDHARKNTIDFPEIDFLCADVFNQSFTQNKYDIITATLFTHHFTERQLMELLINWQQQARIGIIINDLHRHWMAFHSIRFITSLFSNSAMVRNDAPISVMRGFRKSDWFQVLNQCKIEGYALSWHWAFRWLLVIPATA